MNLIQLAVSYYIQIIDSLFIFYLQVPPLIQKVQMDIMVIAYHHNKNELGSRMSHLLIATTAHIFAL